MLIAVPGSIHRYRAVFPSHIFSWKTCKAHTLVPNANDPAQTLSKPKALHCSTTHVSTLIGYLSVCKAYILEDQMEEGHGLCHGFGRIPLRRITYATNMEFRYGPFWHELTYLYSLFILQIWILAATDG